MSTTTKNDLIDRIAGQTEVSRRVVQKVVHGFLASVIDEMRRGNRLELRGFGVFDVRVRAARMSHNPRTLDPVMVPARRKVRFRPGTQMGSAVKAARDAQPGRAPVTATIQTFRRGAAPDKVSHPNSVKR